MAKRKLKQVQKESDDETEYRRPAKQIKNLRKSPKEMRVKNIPLSSDEDLDSSMDNDIDNLLQTSEAATNDSKYDSFSSFLLANDFGNESDNELQHFNNHSRNISNECESSMNKSAKRNSLKEVSLPSTSRDNVFEELEKETQLLSAPSKLTQLVLLQHPASLTLHGYVEVHVWLGSISIFGYEVKENKKIKVFSTEGSGLKQIVTLNSIHKSSEKRVRKRVKNLVWCDDIDIEPFMNMIGNTSVLLSIKKVLLPAPLRFLELYCPNAVQTMWNKNENFENEQNVELCSHQESRVIDTSGDFEKVLEEVQRVISEPDSDQGDFGPRILVSGEKNYGKSTLLRYLINSLLNKQSTVFFLDTDPGQTEYTPPGVLSLVRVTKPLLGPAYSHQKPPLKMIYLGSVTPQTSPTLYMSSVKRLMKYFNNNFPFETLFVNTMGWTQGLGLVCLQSVKDSVKPTICIELVSPDPELSLTQRLDENGTIHFKVPSKAPPKESGIPSYNPKELRKFNLIAYLGQCQKDFMPVTLINSFHPVCVSWDKIALYVMGKKVPPHRLVEAIHCSIVALCHVDLSYVLKSDNPDYPMTLSDEPICECLGFGLVRASDEVNRLFYIVTPLTLDQLKNVNALIKGNIMVPDEIFLKQTIQNVPLPFTDSSQMAKTPGQRGVPKRAFFRSPGTPLTKT